MRTFFILLLSCACCLGDGFGISEAAKTQASSLLDGLVGYWRLEGGAPLWKDESKFGNNLANSNGVTTSTGPSVNDGNCGLFTASSSQFLAVAENSSFNFNASDFCASLWVYVTAPYANRGVVGQWSTTDGAWILYWNGLNAARPMQFYVSSTGSNFTNLNSSVTMSSNTWYHVIAWQVLSSNKLYLSVNGTVDSLTYTNRIHASAATQFRIGNNPNDSSYWNGRIDEVGLWNRGPTVQERALLDLTTSHFPWAHP